MGTHVVDAYVAAPVQCLGCVTANWMSPSAFGENKMSPLGFKKENPQVTDDKHFVSCKIGKKWFQNRILV